MSPLQMMAKWPLAKCPLVKCPLAKCLLAKCPGFIINVSTVTNRVYYFNDDLHKVLKLTKNSYI